MLIYWSLGDCTISMSSYNLSRIKQGVDDGFLAYLKALLSQFFKLRYHMGREPYVSWIHLPRALYDAAHAIHKRIHLGIRRQRV